MAWIWAEMKGSIFFANFTIEKITKELICTPLCIARPLGNIQKASRTNSTFGFCRHKSQR